MNRKLALALISGFTVLSLTSPIYAQPKPSGSSSVKQKLDALNNALRNGVLAQDEHNAKLKSLQADASPAKAGFSATVGRMKTVEVSDPLFR